TDIFQALEDLFVENGITLGPEDVTLEINPKKSLSNFLNPKEGWHIEYDPDEDSMSAYIGSLLQLSNLPSVVPVLYTLFVRVDYHNKQRNIDEGLSMTISPSEKTVTLLDPITDDTLYNGIMKLGLDYGFKVG
ncbi:MAG: hypothetical protein AABW61_00795, partial [Candidatus Aenigmatarchaeota archaeon]